jgi:hypothetical protein
VRGGIIPLLHGYLEYSVLLLPAGRNSGHVTQMGLIKFWLDTKKAESGERFPEVVTFGPFYDIFSLRFSILRAFLSINKTQVLFLLLWSKIFWVTLAEKLW